MTYLFGDATPFPLEENFIETISAAVDACVALFQIHVEQAGRLRQARELAEETDREIAQLGNLASALERALAPLMPKDTPSGPAEVTAAQVAEQANALIQQNRMTLLRRRDASLHAARDVDMGPGILRALERFFIAQQMPKTLWLFDWTSGRLAGEGRLTYTAQCPGELSIDFITELPESSAWSGPVRLEEFDPSFELEFVHKAGFFKRGVHSGKIALQRMYLTRVVRSPNTSWFMLRQNATKPSIGYKVFVRSPEHAGPVILPVDAKEEVGDMLGLDNADEVALHDLWKRLKKSFKEAARYRNQIVVASFRNQSVTDIEEPAEIAECMLMALAPIIREIRVRSRVPGELVLKRDLGDGRREELFVPRRELEKKFASLPYEQRSCFTAVGLDSESTGEFMQRHDVRMMAAERSGDARSMDELKRAKRLHTAGDHNR